MNLKYFSFKHLPENLQAVSEPFTKIALEMNRVLPEGEEKEMCLRKLLESKDCAVRAALEK